MIILTHAPVILTNDDSFISSLPRDHKMYRDGDIIRLPEDAILVAHEEDKEAIKFYNSPMILESKK